MRIPTRRRTRGLQFNITPLIDVVFLLIIFFLAASHFVRSESQESVDLPEATPDKEEASEPPRRLIITVTADTRLHVAGKPVQMQDVEQMILNGLGPDEHTHTDFAVRIRGDKTVPYRVIEPILLACARSGIA